MNGPMPFSYFGRTGRRYHCYLNAQRGYWYAAYHDGFKRRRVALNAKTKFEAEIAVKALDQPAVMAAVHVEKVVWSEFAGRYLQFKTDQGKAGRSVARFKAALEAFERYLTTLGIKAVQDITLTVLEGYQKYRQTVEGCKPKTAYTDVLVLKNALKWASQSSRGILRRNPALEWETREPVVPKRRAYTLNMVERMESGIRPWMRDIVTTLAWSGLRVGELVALRWQDVDLEARVLHVRVREDWKPKGRSDRTVPLHPKVEAAIRRQPVREFVFYGPGGGRIKESYLLECLKADQRKLQLPEGDLHAFRRFFATTMMQLGVPTETVRQWGGWQSLETMLRYLAEVDIKDSVDAMERAARKLQSA